MTTQTAPQQLAVAYTAPGQNANNEPMLNVLGMAVGVKIRADQTGHTFSCVETYMDPFQFGPPPHVHYALDEIMLVLEGTITLLEGTETREVSAGGYHFRPRGVVHTFWNAHEAPARFLDMYPSNTQDFARYLEELSDLGGAIHAEGANPFAPESVARFKALDARYNHEVFYDQMPAHMDRYGPK